MEMVYKTSGTCSKAIRVVLDKDNIITDVQFDGGCNGNLKGVAELVKGRSADDVISTITGIKCGARGTSCPDQLAQALKEALRIKAESAAS